jgi:hypothetical protein
VTGQNDLEELAMRQNTQQTLGIASDIMQRNAHTFWENQIDLCDKMQDFANGWFERQRAGTTAALDGSQRMCRARTPLEFLGEYQKWMAGVLERAKADGLAYQGQLKSVTEGLAPLAPLLPKAHVSTKNTKAARAA